MNFVHVMHEPHGVKRILLTNASKKNALHKAMVAEFLQVLHDLSALTDVYALRLLILQGDGDFYCAGADLQEMQESLNLKEIENLQSARMLGSLYHTLAAFPVPVLSIVQGGAIGGGLGLVACSDFVLADEHALFAAPEVLLGLVPGVISPYIVRKIGLARASGFLLGGRKISAADAVLVGLANLAVHKSQLEQKELEIQNQFLQAGPLAARRTKQLLIHCAPLPSLEVRDFAAAQIAQARASAEGQNGMVSFFQKKSPSWKPLV